jgi:hypothetical protein
MRLNADASTDSIGTITIATDGSTVIATTDTPDFDAGTSMVVTAPSNLHGLADFGITFLGSPV